MRSRLSIVFLLAATTLPAQTRIVVSGGGDALQQAVDAASAGDVLEVRAGTYSATRIAKGLTVLCDPGVELTSVYPGPSALTIENVPAGERASWVRGGNQRATLVPFRTSIRNCAGAVAIEGFAGDSLHVGNSRQVSFNRCTFVMGCGIEDSTVSFSSCTVKNDTGRATCAAGGCGAIDAQRSRVELADSRVTGAPISFFAWNSGAAVRFDGGRLRVAGAATVLTSGRPLQTGTPDAPAILAVAGRVDLDPAVSLVTPVIPQIRGGATVVTVPMPVVRTAGAATGQQMTVATMAEPGSLAATLLLPAGPVTPTPFGDLWLLPPAFAIDAGTIPANGDRIVTLSVLPVSFGQSWTAQAAAITLSGQLVIGPPSVVVFE